MLKEGLWGIAAPNGPGSTARGDGEFCPCSGRCSRSAGRGWQFPTAQAYQPGGQGVLPRMWPVPRGCLQGAVIYSGACPPPGGGGGRVPARLVAVAESRPARPDPPAPV